MADDDVKAPPVEAPTLQAVQVQALPAEDAEFGVLVRGVTRRFGNVDALRGIDLTVPYGQVTALVGPNGAGKTTLLLILATLLRPDQGLVRVGGVDPVASPDAVRAQMGWMPDAFGVYDQLKVGEYLGFFAAAYGLPKAVGAARTAELLDMIHLEEYAHRPVHVLSRGQKQRLALARALIHRPRVLLLDEPASGLDPRSRIELRDLLRGLAAAGTAVLVSSHILTELEEIADRVVFVSGGRTVAEQAMGELSRQTEIAWRVRALEPDALLAALERRGLPMLAPTPAGVDLPAMREDEAAELLAWLVNENVPVVDFGPVGSHLESVYLAMTQERR